MAANPSRFDPELQQYLKKIKVIVSYEYEDKEITWVAENTANHTTRRLEFLVERVATALIPTMSVLDGPFRGTNRYCRYMLCL